MSLADEAGIRDNVMQALLLMFSEQDIGRITEVCTIYVRKNFESNKTQIAPTQSILATAPVVQPGEPVEDSSVAPLGPSTKFSEIPEIQTTP